MRHARKPLVLTLVVASLLLAAFVLPAGQAQAAKPQPPNILFVVLDDVGIDQFQKVFGFGAENAAPTPTIDSVAAGGLRFRNVWAMSECSPSRAAMLTGRYPQRTHIYAPISGMDLANSQLSPYETTLPKVLKQAGYTSALFGKLHVGGEENYPDGDQAPALFGFDHFHGPMGGKEAGAKPDPIDTTAGGVGAPETYRCGFVPNKTADSAHGADSGACYFADGRPCQVLAKNAAEPHPGRACLQQGGIFDPEASCQDAPPATLRFEHTNAYYVWNIAETGADKVIRPLELTDVRSRTYEPTELTTAAIDWIKARQGGPWMATVSYPLIHEPYQQPPASLTPGRQDLAGACAQEESPAVSQELASQMLQAMDTEIGRLLAETGLAPRTGDGELRDTPAASNTMIVILGDNGSYGPAVREPFDRDRAKGTLFQTGIWVPLVVAGPLVHSPNRDVEAMVNVGDLFELFAEIAGLDVRKFVPPSRVLDSVSMLPYLTQPSRPGLRQYNFSQNGANFTANGVRPGPCVLPMALFPEAGSGLTCVQVMADEGSCEGEGGTWYGDEYASCCELRELEPQLGLQGRWLSQQAVRDDGFKFIRTTYEDCRTDNATLTVDAFYEIDQEASPTLDRRLTNLITHPESPLQGLTPEQARSYRLLSRELERILASEVTCPGDGNNDGVVDEEDISNWSSFNGRGSSWYDFPRPNEDGIYVHDGLTDGDDLKVILENLGKCPQK